MSRSHCGGIKRLEFCRDSQPICLLSTGRPRGRGRRGRRTKNPPSYGDNHLQCSLRSSFEGYLHPPLPQERPALIKEQV
ncbi:hypothetical protein EYF80_030813 [Liparis tanakae]|uniref:Uncharacterized protein n=1 Tax=Liparis tanakae TaxID=230148 RepID=A0A4Z2GZR7_9TELE|nr:hypothetical protein EYF80_030813 [Liparis tanakae]